jgi:SAM-dependent methyltransferase
MTDELLPAHRIGSEFVGQLNVYICESCGLSQTLHDMEQDKNYDDYQYSVSSSSFAQTFMRRLAEETYRRYDLEPGASVIEVGTADGSQLLEYQKLGARALGFEPSSHLAAIATSRGLTVAHQLFDDSAEHVIPKALIPASVVLLTYTFDHLPEPRKFLESIRRILDPTKGLLIIEVHDLQKIMERNEFCLFEHEHTTYYTAATLGQVLEKSGFRLIELDLVPERERRGNSLLAVATLQGSKFDPHESLSDSETSASPPLDYVGYGQRLGASLERLKEFVAERRGKIRLAGYGAGGRGVITLAACAQPGDFAYVADMNSAFHGLYTPVSHVPVVDPRQLHADPVDELLVFSFGYFEEIAAGLADLRAKGLRLTSLLDVLRPS